MPDIPGHHRDMSHTSGTGTWDIPFKEDVPMSRLSDRRDQVVILL